VVFDPVLTKEMDGLEAEMMFRGKNIHFKFHVKNENTSPKELKINGNNIDFVIEQNQYRKGGAQLNTVEFERFLVQGLNSVEITL
jgi:cellobiose phosphorylase